jgi:hypothetical protein
LVYIFTNEAFIHLFGVVFDLYYVGGFAASADSEDHVVDDVNAESSAGKTQISNFRSCVGCRIILFATVRAKDAIESSYGVYITMVGDERRRYVFVEHSCTGTAAPLIHWSDNGPLVRLVVIPLSCAVSIETITATLTKRRRLCIGDTSRQVIATALNQPQEFKSAVSLVPPMT